MNRDDQKSQFIQQAKARLDQSEKQVDSITQSRLRDARREALMVKRRAVWQLPATAFASFVLCAVLIAGLISPADELPLTVDLFEDVALLSGQEELEMYEDIDLILWMLDEEAENGLG